MPKIRLVNTFSGSLDYERGHWRYQALTWVCPSEVLG